jgi:hypothetical protein
VWLFPWIGVAHSTWVVCGLLVCAACAMSLSSRWTPVIATAVLAVVVASSALAAGGPAEYAFDSAYQSIRIVKEDGESGRPERILIMSGSRSSGVYADTGETSFSYVLAAEKALKEAPAAKVLVVGSAGFTFPRDVAAFSFVQRIDAVDVDPVVKRVAEREFLRQPLPANVRFLPLSARYAVRRLHRDGEHYGFAFIDAYFGKGIPEELVTVEFFRDVRAVSDRVAANVVMDRDLESAFGRNVLASFREAFGAAWVTDVKPGDSETTNIMVANWPAAGARRWDGAGEPYRDDRNTADRDHVAMVWGGAE